MAIVFPVGCLMKKSYMFLLLPLFLDLFCIASPINFKFSLLIKIRFFSTEKNLLNPQYGFRIEVHTKSR